MNQPAREAVARRAIRLVDLPDLARPVGLHGALAQSEVGGSACYGVVVALVRSA